MERIHTRSAFHGGSYGSAKLFQQQREEPAAHARRGASGHLCRPPACAVAVNSQPLTDAWHVASAGLGALLALMAVDMEFSLIAFLGILLLIGIVKKNAIMNVVDFALELSARSPRSRSAIAPRACSPPFQADHDDDVRGDRGRASPRRAMANGTRCSSTRCLDRRRPSS